MSDDGKEPVQAAGPGENPAGGHDDPGESGGGAYPNPHTGKTPKGFEGGQTEVEQKPDPGEDKTDD